MVLLMCLHQSAASRVDEDCMGACCQRTLMLVVKEYTSSAFVLAIVTA
jgi:hypothetical protein